MEGRRAGTKRPLRSWHSVLGIYVPAKGWQQPTALHMVHIHPVVTKECVCMCERVCVCMCMHACLGARLLLSCFGLKKRLEKGSLQEKYWGCKLALLGNSYCCHLAEIIFLFSWVQLIIFLICREKAACVYHWSVCTFAAAQVRLCWHPALPVPQPQACGGLPCCAIFQEH